MSLGNTPTSQAIQNTRYKHISWHCNKNMYQFNEQKLWQDTKWCFVGSLSVLIIYYSQRIKNVNIQCDMRFIINNQHEQSIINFHSQQIWICRLDQLPSGIGDKYLTLCPWSLLSVYIQRWVFTSLTQHSPKHPCIQHSSSEKAASVLFLINSFTLKHLNYTLAHTCNKHTHWHNRASGWNDRTGIIR